MHKVSATKLVLLMIVTISNLSFAQLRRGAKEQQATSSGGSIALSHRHIVVINADPEKIYGSYFFAVDNTTGEPANFTTKVMIPERVVDFRPQDGLEEGDLKLDNDGVIVLDKTFPPGLSLVGVGFQIGVGAFGNEKLRFTPFFDLPEFSIAVLKDSGMTLSSAELETGIPAMLRNGNYTGLLSSGPLKAGVPVEVFLDGIPKYRVYLWFVGLACVLVLLGLGVSFAIKTRPRT